MENGEIRLLPANVEYADRLADYYRRNREFLRAFEPIREEAFYTPEYQRDALRREMDKFEAGTEYRFYIERVPEPRELIGTIALSNVVWGAFRSAYLGYKLDARYINRGYMTQAVAMLVRYAFEVLGLHRIEGNVMPRNGASLRVLEKNQFVNEGTSRFYLNINGVWEDHIHMVRINYGMH